MSKHARDKRPYVRPVERITLNADNVRLRWILTAVLILIAAAAIGLGVHYAIEVEPGWNPVEPVCDEPNYSSEIQLMYDFSVDPGNASAINKTLTNLYSEIMEESYRIFSKDADIEGVHNVFYLNQHINEQVTVEPELYEAMALLKRYDNRCIFLAPVYAEYYRVMAAETDVEARMYDPARDIGAEDYVSQLMTYLTDPAMVDIALLGDNRVILQVGDAYREFARENEITEFLDFGWLRNAFVVDYAAETLLEKGFSHGYLASYDGFNRNLSEAGQPLDFNLFDRQGTEIYLPGKMTYGGRRSIVFLRDFPLSSLDRWNYYVYDDGSIASVMVAPDTGKNEAAVSNLVGYGFDIGCSEILMEMLPIYLDAAFAPESLAVLAEKGIHSVWCGDGVINYNDPELTLTTLENQDGVNYTLYLQ